MSTRLEKSLRTAAAAVVANAIVLGLAAQAHAQAKPATKVTMRLDWKPGGQYSPFYYGKEKGYYTAEGVDLTIVPGSGSSDRQSCISSHSRTSSGNRTQPDRSANKA